MKEKGKTYFNLRPSNGNKPAVLGIIGTTPEDKPYVSIYERDSLGIGYHMYDIDDADLKRLYKALGKHLGVAE